MVHQKFKYSLLCESWWWLQRLLACSGVGSLVFESIRTLCSCALYARLACSALSITDVTDIGKDEKTATDNAEDKKRMMEVLCQGIHKALSHTPPDGCSCVQEFGFEFSDGSEGSDMGDIEVVR